MAMHKVPTLVLGIGGIGCRIAANIADLLTPEARERVAVVGVDTNVNDLNKLATRGLRTIRTSDNRTVGEYLQHHPQYMSWFPLSKFLVSKTMVNGAGQIRAVSRMAALAAEEAGAFITIKEELQRIRLNTGEDGKGNLTVMVVGSITGGTGAGLFLQLPFYIRKVLIDEAGLDNIIIRGMFVGPDLTADLNPSPINREAVRVNGYSCLKELNALYMLQTHPEGPGKLNVDFYVPVDDSEIRRQIEDMQRRMEEAEMEEDDGTLADMELLALGNPKIPYDYLYLIERSTAEGTIGNAPVESVESLAARMVFTLMFTPVKDNALSVEDNMVLNDMAYGGMNRYSSAGMTRLIYPKDLAQEYVTLSTVRDLVRSEWLVIDDGFRDQVAEARTRQKTDGQVKLPLMKHAFTELFRKQVSGEGTLGKLFHEAFVSDPVTREDKSRAELYWENLNQLIAELEETADLKAARDKCALNVSKMNAVTSAASEISRVYTDMENYELLARKLAVEKPASIANEMFPPSWRSMAQNMGNSRNIYQLLHNVHPLTARFLCYDLMQRLEQRIEELEGSVAGLDLDGYLEEDFDKKEAGNQTAGQAVRKIQANQVPLLSSLGADNGKLRRLKTKLSPMVDTQRELVSQYLRESLELAVSKILVRRLESLMENYRVFFQGIEAMIKENNDRIAKLEDLKMPLGQKGVYCSKEAFQVIAAEYRNAVDCELSTETKTSVFESLYKVLATEFENETRVLTEKQKANNAAQKIKDLNSIFTTAVVDTIRTSVVEKGAGIVDMTISQALERQYALLADDSQDYTQYLRKLIKQSMGMAAPMLATTDHARANLTATAYLAIHPDCAATEMGQPDTGATRTLLIPQALEETDNLNTTVLMDEAFSPYEIVCFRARYKFSIEDLVKYSPTSENARAYRKRISSVGKSPVNTGDPDDFKTVVNPHLDRYWHETAYLPSIYDGQRRTDHMNVLKAFLYALGLDKFMVIVDDAVLDENGNSPRRWYYHSPKGYVPVKARGRFIGSSMNDLFDALPFNGRIVDRILADADAMMRASKGYKSAEELADTILDDPFIADLIQSATDSDAVSEDNLLDIFMDMRNGMPLETWRQLFTGLKEVLWEYCAFLFDKNERVVNLSYRAILDKLMANCRIKGKSDLNYTENELMTQFDAIYKDIYKR